MNRYVNLGCGARYHPDWVNIDIAPLGPGVIAHDLSRGVPLADASADVVYHSHVLEHLRRDDAAAFMRECARVLRPGGIIRVAVPDLERICRAYLEKMEAALGGDAGAAADYDWMMLELLDQTTRERGGGAMGAYLRREPLVNEAFVLERIGEEGRRMIESVRAPRTAQAGRRRTLGSMARGVRGRLLRLLLGADDARALAVGRFRLGGEVHQWMYDRWSLARLLRDSGFGDPTVHAATTSGIAGWGAFNLDTLSDGTVVKPDSLFMEGRRGEN